MSFDKLDSNTSKFNDIDVITDIYTGYTFGVNIGKPKFKTSDYVRHSKCRSIASKTLVPTKSEKEFVPKRVKNTVLWMDIFPHLKEYIVKGTFYKRDLRKTEQVCVEKVVKLKDDKLFVKRKSLFSSFINKAGIVGKACICLIYYVLRARVEFDFVRYATESDLSKAWVVSCTFANNADLANIGIWPL